jgi:hypothetical protein
LTPPVELCEQGGKGQEVRDAEARPSGGEHEERIRPLHVGPARRERAHPIVAGLAEEDPVLTPGVGVSDEVERLAVQGMERVGDDEPPLTAGTASSRRLTTMPTPSA